MRNRTLRIALTVIGCWLALSSPACGQDAKPKPASEQINKLIQNLKAADPYIRFSSAYALGDMGAAAAVALPDLTVLLRDPDSRVRVQAALVLGKIGAAALSVGPRAAGGS